MNTIARIWAREILDSRGWPTVEVEVTLRGGQIGRFAVPAGASTGQFEALELRDGDVKRYAGRGVQKAVHIVNEVIASELVSYAIPEQKQLDDVLCALDGTPNKSSLGANAMLGVSVAVAKAAAQSANMDFFRFMQMHTTFVLPVPFMNVLNGGMHADNDLQIQEAMIVPVGASSFHEALRMGAEVFHCLKTILKKKNLVTGVGDEGGFAPQIAKTEDALDLLMEAIQVAGFRSGAEIMLAMDAAASEFFDKKKNAYHFEGEWLDSNSMISFWSKIANAYPIVSIEDGLHDDDWQGWSAMTKTLGEKIQLVGDDLFVTNPQRIRRGIDEAAANAVLIKLNQIGTLTESIEAVSLAHKAGLKTMISHRSGETEDTTIADLAVAWGTGQIKAGSLCRGERICKYNQLLRIEQQLGSAAHYGGEMLRRVRP
jgi:enolase